VEAKEIIQEVRSHLDTLVQLNVCLLNDGEKSTFSRVGRESIIDLTFASPDLARNAAWHISDLYTHSDHSAVITEIRISSAIRRMHPARHVGYKIDTLDRQSLLSSTGRRAHTNWRCKQLCAGIRRSHQAGMRVVDIKGIQGRKQTNSYAMVE